MRGRIVAGMSVAAAVTAGAVGGALIGVPSLSGAEQFPNTATLAASTAQATVTATGGQATKNAPLLDAAAQALGLTTQQLRDKLSDGKTTIADVAKQQNVDVNKVIDAMTAAERDRISNIVNQPWHGGPVPGPGGAAGVAPGFGPRMGKAIAGLAGAGLDTVAKALGISTDELKTDLQNGQSIAAIAKAKNVDVNKVIDAIVSAASSRLDQLVKDGTITQATADKIEANLKQRVTDMVNLTPPKLGAGPFGRHGMRGHFGPGGPGGPGSGPGGPGGPATTTPTTKAPTS